MLSASTLRAQAEALAQSRICIQLRGRDTNGADPLAIRVAHVQDILRPLASFALEIFTHDYLSCPFRPRAVYAVAVVGDHTDVLNNCMRESTAVLRRYYNRSLA